MPRIQTVNFYKSIEAAPQAACDFFTAIINHFELKNDVQVHHTDTNGGDLRLAIPAHVLGKNYLRNFATLYWQKRKQVVFTRTFLSLRELKAFGVYSGTIPNSDKEPLNSDVRLSEPQWRDGTPGFINVLEAAKVKMLKSYGIQ